MLNRRPTWRDEIFVANLARHAFYDRFRREALEEVDDQVRVLFQRRQRDLACAPKALQTRSFNDVEMVNFNRMETERSQAARRRSNVLARFAGETENNVRADLEITRARAHRRVDELTIIVPATEPV